MVSPSSSDVFALLGLPAQFDLDPAAIEQAFFVKSKDLHADRFASAPAGPINPPNWSKTAFLAASSPKTRPPTAIAISNTGAREKIA